MNVAGCCVHWHYICAIILKNFMNSLIKQAQQKPIAGSILKAASVIYFPMHPCAENLQMKILLLMVKGSISARTILSWGIIFLYRKKVLPFISMLLIFLSGACWKKLR